MQLPILEFCRIKNITYICTPNRYHGRVVRQRSAKPSTAVRICLVPHKRSQLNVSTDFFYLSFLLSLPPIFSYLFFYCVFGCMGYAPHLPAKARSAEKQMPQSTSSYGWEKAGSPMQRIYPLRAHSAKNTYGKRGVCRFQFFSRSVFSLRLTRLAGAQILLARSFPPLPSRMNSSRL